MDMSWLIILFFVNGQPTMLDGFPPKMMLTINCQEQQKTIVDLIATVFPYSAGMAFCIPDNGRSEAPSVGT